MTSPQDVRVDELPFGTRGGLAVRRYFPLDGEYNFKMDSPALRASRIRSKSPSTASAQWITTAAKRGRRRGAGQAADAASRPKSGNSAYR